MPDAITYSLRLSTLSLSHRRQCLHERLSYWASSPMFTRATFVLSFVVSVYTSDLYLSFVASVRTSDFLSELRLSVFFHKSQGFEVSTSNTI